MEPIHILADKSLLRSSIHCYKLGAEAERTVLSYLLACAHWPHEGGFPVLEIIGAPFVGAEWLARHILAATCSTPSTSDWADPRSVSDPIMLLDYEDNCSPLPAQLLAGRHPIPIILTTPHAQQVEGSLTIRLTGPACSTGVHYKGDKLRLAAQALAREHSRFSPRCSTLNSAERFADCAAWIINS